MLENLFNEVYVNYNNNFITMLILFFFLCFNTYTDIKYFKIYDNVIITMFLAKMLLVSFNIPIMATNIYGAVFLFIVFLGIGAYLMIPMGGDIKLSSVLGFWLGLYSGTLIVFLALITSMVYIFVNKKNTYIPFAPFVLIWHTIFLIAVKLFTALQIEILPGIISYI